MEEQLFIKTKDQRIKPFNLNKGQLKYATWYQSCLDQRISARAIILKARQMGFSTLIEGLMFAMTMTHPNVHSRILAHDADSTANIYAMTEMFYDSLDESIKPMKARRNRNEITFENPIEEDRGKTPGLRSKIEVNTARNVRAGRSATIHNVHCSEVAFWDDPATLVTGLMRGVPDKPLTSVVLESTANGIGNYFHHEWILAEPGLYGKPVEGDYTPFFFPWFEDEDYRSKLNAQERKEFNLDPEEKRLKEKYGLDLEQLKWRRKQIRQMAAAARAEKNPAKIGLSGLQLFRQEYPADPREAFISTGRPVFDGQALDWYERTQMRSPEFVGDLMEDRNGKLIIQEGNKGALSVWETPVRGEGYIIGADFAEGIASGDYTSYHVVSQKGYNVVAHWWGHIDIDLAAEELEKLGMYYNEAFIVPERNNQGLVVCLELRARRYRRVYTKTIKGLRTGDKRRDEIGWRTDKASKPVMIADLASDVRDHTLGIPSQETIDEMYKYVRNERGQTQAQEGAHDDRVISLALALQGHLDAPKMFRSSRKRMQRRRKPERTATDASSFTGYN